MPEHGFPAICDALAGLEVFAVVDGKCAPLDDASLAASHQTWVRDTTGAWRVDVIREPWDGDTWICRRDARLRRPRDEAIARTADGIPYQQPEIALLFKAKHTREKDQADFDEIVPLLRTGARRWLAEALELAHPGHVWIERLRAS